MWEGDAYLKYYKMKIGVITYDKPHRKTQDVVMKLILNGYRDIHLLMIPWIERKNHIPIYQHRPVNCVNLDPCELALALKIRASYLDKTDLSIFDRILIAGAGIIQVQKAINSHPGYLPNVRGLDALKWAIYSGQPIGVTTHYISNEVDEGELIERRILPIYFEDTFHSVAQRVYETEIEMLVNAITLPSRQSLKDPQYTANKRMPHAQEIVMMSRFEQWRKKSPSMHDYLKT